MRRAATWLLSEDGLILYIGSNGDVGWIEENFEGRGFKLLQSNLNFVVIQTTMDSSYSTNVQSPSLKWDARVKEGK